MHTSTPHRKGSIYHNADSKQEKPTAILGFGREGRSLLKFLKKSEKYRNARIAILDRTFDKNYLKNLSLFGAVFRSPGVPYTLPEVQAAITKGVRVTSATKLFFSEIGKIKKKKPTIIGVTGTKGKGTTCTLIARMLAHAGRRVVLAGNIGLPMLDALPQAKRADFVILELSSFQLQDLDQSPQIAVVLDIFPDHLDAHKNLREYYSAKAHIGRFQRKSDAIFFFARDPLSRRVAMKSPARKFPVHALSLRPSRFSNRNPAIWKNYDMASAVARFAGVPDDVIARTIKNFRGIEHRLELVRILRIRRSSQIATQINAENIRGNQRSNLRKSASIKFYNDSAATNPEAAAAAIASIAEPLICIAGGKNKDLNYTPLARKIARSPQVKAVVLFGENKNEIKKTFAKIKNHDFKIVVQKDLKSAVKSAYQIARASVIHDSQFVILFSPASASFDMFNNYAERGLAFKRIVHAL